MKIKKNVFIRPLISLNGKPKFSAGESVQLPGSNVRPPGILFITSYPPRQCGIATYSQDLVKALQDKFDRSFTISICALESEHEQHEYDNRIEYRLNTSNPADFTTLANIINRDNTIQLVVIQHEFGFFQNAGGPFLLFLEKLAKPVITAFHTVLPHPHADLRTQVSGIADASEQIIVMTNSSARILADDYGITAEKINVIPHGTHLVPFRDKGLLKKKYKVGGRTILSTFGLLGPGKSIETTLEALPAITRSHPDVLFLIIGKTHPSIVKHDKETYRQMLEAKVKALHLEQHVRFINYFLPLPDLLEYLQLTDIYVFTSKDPNQAVSGTFSYAMSCGCPVISTPIPHAVEVLRGGAGIIIDFLNSRQLETALSSLLTDEQVRKNISLNALHRMAPTAWENAAIKHTLLFKKILADKLLLNYTRSPINLDHLKKMTTEFGILQFARIDQPDPESGYTLDDNARALIAVCMHFEMTGDEADLLLINIYFDFIRFCIQPDGSFLNYVDQDRAFTTQNEQTNLADSNGRAIWALGYLISLGDKLPAELFSSVRSLMPTALLRVHSVHSTRAMAFIIKGLFLRSKQEKSLRNTSLIKQLANRLVQMYRHESAPGWLWFESYLTYANSILPEAMLCAWQATGDSTYRDIGKTSFDFLLSKIFSKEGIKVISNKGWLESKHNHTTEVVGGEQPIDVAYTIVALNQFYEVFQDNQYLHKMQLSFSWFMGNNHLQQIIYNPGTGGCYDGLEDTYVNLNQGAESSVSYLIARLTMERIKMPAAEA